MELPCYQHTHFSVLIRESPQGWKILAFKIIKLNPLLNNPCFLEQILFPFSSSTRLVFNDYIAQFCMNKIYEHFSCRFLDSVTKQTYFSHEYCSSIKCQRMFRL